MSDHQIPVLVVYPAKEETAVLCASLEEAGFTPEVAHEAEDAERLFHSLGSSLYAVITKDASELPERILSALKECHPEKSPILIETQSQPSHSQKHFWTNRPMKPHMLVLMLQSALKEKNQAHFVEDLQDKQLIYLRTKALQFRFQTLEDCYTVAEKVAALYPNPRMAMLGLTELMINAVEHGNLGITFEEKCALHSPQHWQAEVARRAALPHLKERFAELRLYQSALEIKAVIEDQGDGFDHKRFEGLEIAQSHRPCGRGIAVAKHLSFDKMHYSNGGRTVTCVVYRRT